MGNPKLVFYKDINDYFIAEVSCGYYTDIASTVPAVPGSYFFAFLDHEKIPSYQLDKKRTIFAKDLILYSHWPYKTKRFWELCT
jgi:hypothetical protein